MSTVKVNKDISLEDAQRTLSDALGSGYRVSVTSNSSLKVTRNFIIWGTVHVSTSPDGTTFRVRPGGLILVAAINAAYTTPKIRRALGQAYPQPAH